MRSVCALVLFIGLCAPANAANAHRTRSRHLVVRPGQEMIVRPNQEADVPPGWYKFPGYPPIPPELNRNLDASTRGGG
jgi:hypothetical protein